jgi:gluconate 2-dehydrogenase subunit 3-like protein
MAHELGRRDLIKLTAGAAISSARAAGQPKFFTPDEFAMVEELTELIIPADEHSGGAKAARTAEYIDGRLAEAFEQAERDAWRKGLARVNALSREMHGAAFLPCTAAQRLAVVTRMAAHEQDPKAPREIFFGQLKSYTVQGYYTSKVGIHDDMGYLGNTIQQGEYAGELPKPTSASR